MPDRESAHPDPLPAGTPAPPFRLPAVEAADFPPGHPPPADRWRSLDELAGAPAVLVFYPADFTPVCGEELAIFSELLPELEALGAQVVGISVDSVWCHRAYCEQRNVRIPLLSDFHPKGEVSRRYGCYREDVGVSERALFVLDREGKVFWSALSPMDENPGVDGVLDALERLGRQEEGAGAAPPRREARDEARP
jgi:peroxiredoxin (alkyl hydroperoxide reductase subunit C)